MTQFFEVTSTIDETEIAINSSKVLVNYLEINNLIPSIRLQNGTTQQTVTIPKSVLPLLVEILAEIAKGNSVKIVPIKKELTTSEAASILNVSRPYLVSLLESGKIPFHKIGVRRRIQLQDLMAYKNEIDRLRENSLAELTAQAQELNMGY